MRCAKVPTKKMLWGLEKEDITYTTYSNFDYGSVK